MEQSFVKIMNCSSKEMKQIKDQSVDLIVTSPPYPMVEMWDECFAMQSVDVRKAFAEHKWRQAWIAMHQVLNNVWLECNRVLKESGFICINIGDATRTFDGTFQLFSNHSAIISFFESMGYCTLPDIHWRKQTNAPNKFMGSGMYPAGAYVTYEHEYILIFRKGGKRIFKGAELVQRRKSAYFWEERNVWFSDLWEIKGVQQKIHSGKTRERSAAFPVSIPYRLINMYSAYGDTVLDPFGGIGTTATVCAALNRNCYIADIDPMMCEKTKDAILAAKQLATDLVDNRVAQHLLYIQSLANEKLAKCYVNIRYGFLVKTKQEIEIVIYKISHIEAKNDDEFIITHQESECQSAISTIKSVPVSL